MKKTYHKIATAYDAWWFLYNHPKLMLRERNEEPKFNADALEKRGFIITRDKGGKCWREWRHLHRHAIEENFSIFYTKVDSSGKVNDDPVLNIQQACWLEMGPMEWGYCADWMEETSLINYHDIELDSGGRTFDDALVSLARKVRRGKYGDYCDRKGRQEHGACGRPSCADCRKMERGIKGLKKG